jgi:hypothetical protein
MQKQLIKTLALLFVAICPLFSNSQSNNLTRKVLHTLKVNEVLHADEALIHTGANSSNFCLIINDTIKNTQSFIYNGNVILETKDGEGFWLRTGALDLTKKNGFILEYSISNKEYLNLNGVIYGPYETVKPFFCKSTNEIGIFYKLGSKFYLKVNDQKFGPFSEYHMSILLNDTKRIFGIEGHENYSAVVSGNDYLEIVDSKQLSFNNKLINNNHQDISYIRSLSFNSIKNFGYIAVSSLNYNLASLWLNGEIKQNLNQIQDGDLLICDNNKGYYLNSNQTNSILKDGNILYNQVNNLIFSDNNGLFIYEGGNNSLYLNGKLIFNKADVEIIQAAAISSNQYAFSYYKNDEYFVKTAQTTFGPFNYVDELKYSANGSLKFLFSKENNYYLNDNGTIIQQEISPSFYSIYANESLKYKGHTLENSYDYDYVVIDGESFGSSSALQSWIDQTNNSFKWTAMENNDYVLYSYTIR